MLHVILLLYSHFLVLFNLFFGPFNNLIFFMLQALLNSQLKSRLLNKEILTLIVNLLDFIDGIRVVLKIFNNFKLEVLNDACDAFMPIHHFLVVAFDLVRSSCIK